MAVLYLLIMNILFKILKSITRLFTSTNIVSDSDNRDGTIIQSNTRRIEGTTASINSNGEYFISADEAKLLERITKEREDFYWKHHHHYL